MKKEEKYCWDCGSLMMERKLPNGFNSKTGKQEWRYKYKCPKDTFWNTLTLRHADTSGPNYLP